MAGSRKTVHHGKLFRTPTDVAAISGNFAADQCYLRIRTRLVSVRVPEDSSVLQKGSILPVISQKLASGSIAIVINPKTKEAIGTLFPAEIDLLMHCIGLGFHYSAEVIEATGADVLVEIVSQEK